MSGCEWQWDSFRQNWCYWDPAQLSWVYHNPDEPDQSNEKSASTEIVDLVHNSWSHLKRSRNNEKSASTDSRDPRYKTHFPGREFYKVGKVFKVLWAEPVEGPLDDSASCPFPSGALTYDKIRWFIVIREGQECCTCLPIQTYNHRGVAKSGVIKGEHSVVYSESSPPQILEWEDPHGEMLPAIRIIASEPSEPGMNSRHRINYAKPYTVEHNVKSLEFGNAAEAWTPLLLQNFLYVLQSPSPGISHRQPTGPEKSQPRSDQSSRADQNLTLVSQDTPILKTRAVLADVEEVVIYDQAQRQSLRRSSTAVEVELPGIAPKEELRLEALKRERSFDELDTSSSEMQQPRILPQPAIPPAASAKDVIDSQEIQIPDAGQAHSDSGYHSGRGTDTASVCSIESSGSSLGLPTNFLQDFIEFFGNNLIAMAGVREWMPYAEVAHKSAGIEAHLDHLLKRYALDLEELVSEIDRLDKSATDKPTLARFDHSIAKDAINLIRRYRPKIARYFRQNALSPIDSNALTLSRLKDYGIRLSLDERISSLFATPQTDEGFSQEEDLDLDEAEDNENLNLGAIKDFLLSQRPFKDLMASMRRDLYCDDQSQMRQIRDIITNTVLAAGSESNSCLDCSCSIANTGSTEFAPCKYCLEDRHYRTSYSVAWNPIDFLESQFNDRRSLLANVLVLSGSGLYAYATTCAEYVRSTWPNSWNVLLPLLQGLLENPPAALTSEDGASVSIAFECTWLGEKKQDSVRLEINGSIPFTIEIVQQVSWLAVALRGGLSETTVSYSEPSISEVASHEQNLASFNISVTERRLDPKEESCWFTLFNSAVITRGFPIPERESVPGLEIQLDILAALAGVRHAVEFHGGVVLKGFSTMLVPTERTQDRVRWHLVRSEVDKHLAYEDGVKQCPNRLMIHEINLDALQSTKAFVGWCSDVKMFLGSEMINYDNLHYSGIQLEDCNPNIKLSGGAFGFSQFGVAQLNVSFGARDGKCHFQRNNGPYREIVAMAESMPVNLHDSYEKRAWLVRASYVMLHVIQARCQTGFLGDIKEQIRVFSKDPSEGSAQDLLLRDAENIVLVEEDYRLKDVVLDIWSLLEYLAAYKDHNDATPGIEPKLNMRQEIHGFEFRDVVQKKSPCVRRKCNIAKTSGGWVNLVQDIGALTLFANGFEDLIRPSDTCQSLCRRWLSLPKGEDYLAVTVCLLKDLYEVAGCPLDRKFLTNSRLQWHQNFPVFQPCESHGAYHCGCNRLSQILGKHAVGTVNGPGNLDPYGEGAVIFGQSGTLLDSICNSKTDPTAGLYSQENQDISMIQKPDSSGPSESSTSESGSSVQHSDTSESVAVSSISTMYSDDYTVRQLEETHLEERLDAEHPTPAANPRKHGLHSLSQEGRQQKKHPSKQVEPKHREVMPVIETQLHPSTPSLVSRAVLHASKIPLPKPRAPLASSRPRDQEAGRHGLRRKYGQASLGMSSRL